MTGSGTIAPRKSGSALSTGDPSTATPAFCSGRAGLASRVMKKPGIDGAAASAWPNSTS